MATVRLFPPAWVTEVEHGETDFSHAFMTEEWVAGVLYGIERKTGSLKWQAAPEGPRWRMEALGAEKHVLVAEGGGRVYRFDMRTGQPLWINRGSRWSGRVAQWIDRRTMRTVERHTQPFRVKNGEIIGYLGEVFSVQTGRIVGAINPAGLVHEHNALDSSVRPGVYDVEGDIGTLYFGTPGDVRLPSGKNEWFLRRPDDTIAWLWEGSNLNGVIGAEANFSRCDLEPYKMFLFLLFHVPAEKKGYSKTAEYTYLAIQDLRNGDILGVQKISDIPLRSPEIDGIDDKGILIRGADAAVVEKTQSKDDYIRPDKIARPGVIRLFYLPLTYK